MILNLKANPQFKSLMSGDFLNPDTTRAFLAEVMQETLGPDGIAHQHFTQGQGEWPALKRSTVRRKDKPDKRKFVQSGRVLTAISTKAHGGSLRDWGSSADINSRGSWTPKRYSENGIYAQAKATRRGASLTIGFNGRYKHSAGFNRVRREAARKKLGKKRITAKEMRRAVSVGEAQARLTSVNADRRARGLKSIRKTAAMGSKGMAGRGHELARGKDNLAYADIVQRGEFKGVRDNTGLLFNPRGLSGAVRRGVHVSGSAEFGVARPLLPFKTADVGRIEKALARSWAKTARELNRSNPWDAHDQF